MRLLLLRKKYRGALRKLFFAGVSAAVFSAAAIIFARHEIATASQDRVTTTVETVPDASVALVLGCAKRLSNGRQNLYFHYRIAAASELYHAGAVEYILVSGDNSRIGYDESTDMKASLVASGVPAERIVCDYAGFSTLDSVVRAKEVFQLDTFIVVSQDFHVRRAIYIGQQHGIDAHGFAAKDVGGAGGIRITVREQLAKVKTVLDVNVLGREPHFLGAPIDIGADIAH